MAEEQWARNGVFHEKITEPGNSQVPWVTQGKGLDFMLNGNKLSQESDMI